MAGSKSTWKGGGISTSTVDTKSSRSEVQKWVCDQIIDFSRGQNHLGPVSLTEPKTPAERLHDILPLNHPVPVDNKSKLKSVPAPSGRPSPIPQPSSVSAVPELGTMVTLEAREKTVVGLKLG